MKSSEELEEFLRHGYKYFMTEITIDCAIFGYHNQELKLLLTKWTGFDKWGLPGGFVKKEESLNQAAARILKERTSLDNIYLQQFYTFGDNNRSKILPADFIEGYGEDNWLVNRTVSIGYFALIDYSKAKVIPDIFFTEFKWQPVTELPELLFDHSEMVEKALDTMRNQMYRQPIGINLLPEKFTLSEIHVLYETILNKKVDKRNFFNKLMSLGILIKLDEKKKIGNHRSPALYKFDEAKYEEALKKGIAVAF